LFFVLGVARGWSVNDRPTRVFRGIAANDAALLNVL
jgi:hypothetical protein